MVLKLPRPVPGGIVASADEDSSAGMITCHFTSKAFSMMESSLGSWNPSTSRSSVSRRLSKPTLPWSKNAAHVGSMLAIAMLSLETPRVSAKEVCKVSSMPGVVSLKPTSSIVDSIVLTGSGSLMTITGGLHLVNVV